MQRDEPCDSKTSTRRAPGHGRIWSLGEEAKNPRTLPRKRGRRSRAEIASALVGSSIFANGGPPTERQTASRP